MNELEALRQFARDFLTFAARAERHATSVAPSDAFDGRMSAQWKALLRRARHLTAPENQPN